MDIALAMLTPALDETISALTRDPLPDTGPFRFVAVEENLAVAIQPGVFVRDDEARSTRTVVIESEIAPMALVLITALQEKAPSIAPLHRMCRGRRACRMWSALS
jgi:hypothetical protein